MSVTDKVRSLLNLKDEQVKYLADFFGISIQAVRNKFSRGSFSASDLIIIAEALGYELSFLPPNYHPYEDKKITLSIEDLSDEERKQILVAKEVKEKERIQSWVEQLKYMTPSELQKVEENLAHIKKFIDDRN